MAAAVFVHACAGVVVARAGTDRAEVRGRYVSSCVSSSSSAWQRGPSQFRMVGAAAAKRTQQRGVVVVKATGEGVETTEAKVAGDVLPSAEWPENFSLLNFEDLISHYEPALFKAEVCVSFFR